MCVCILRKKGQDGGEREQGEEKRKRVTKPILVLCKADKGKVFLGKLSSASHRSRDNLSRKLTNETLTWS